MKMASRFTEKRTSMAEMYSADACFTTGTMGELFGVTEIDSRKLGSGKMVPVTKRLKKLHQNLAKTAGERLPF